MLGSSSVLPSSRRAEADLQTKDGDVLSDDSPAQRIAGQQNVSTPSAMVNVAELARQRDYYPEAATEEESIPEPQPSPGDIPVPAGTKVQDVRATESRPAMRAPAAGEMASAVSSGTSPLPSLSFSALLDDTTAVPPDTQGAVGPNHLMVTLNSQVRFQDRNGNELVKVKLSDFWATLGNFAVFDPKVIYDAFSRRWVFVTLADSKRATSAILVAVSATSDPTGNWTLYKIKADDSSLLWADYPSVGFNKNWIVVSVNMFDSAFRYSKVYAINEAELYAGGTIHFASFQDTPAIFTEAPALTYDATQPAMYMVAAMNGNSVRISTITGAVGSEVMTAGVAFVSIASPWSRNLSSPDFAPQLGSSSLINTGDDRMLKVVYRNGSLWCTHDVFLPAGVPTHSAVQWWQFQPDGTVQQLGRIDDASGNIFCAYPSIAVNRNNDVLIGYSDFSAQGYASAAYNYRAGGDSPSRLRDGILLKGGESSYFKIDDRNRNRWGDYSNTLVDPLNDFDMWTIQEYAASRSIFGQDRWGTWWGMIVPDETPSSVPAITSLAARLAGDVLTLTGTATDPTGDITQADVAILNSAGAIIGDSQPFNYDFGTSAVSSFTIGVTHLNNYPQAVRASLTIVDSQGNRSEAMSADFSQADAGGPNIKNVSYDSDGGVLTIKGAGFADQLQLEVNGVVVAPPLRIKIKGGVKLKISGSFGSLNLRNGANRVVIVNGGLRSNIFVMGL